MTKFNWTVDVRTHSILQIVERLLSEDFDWADEPPPDDKSVARMSWPWWGGGDKDKDKDKDPKKKVRLPVPVAKEEVDCVVSLGSSVLCSATGAHDDERIALTGSMVNGKSRSGIHV